MRTVLSLLCLTIISFFKSAAQENCDCFERLRHLAEYQYDRKQMVEAYSSLSRAFTYRDPSLITSDDYLFMADLELSQKKPDKAKASLIRAAEQGADVDKDISSYEQYKPFIDDAFTSELKAAALRHKARIDIAYLMELEQLHGIDQAIRTYPSWTEQAMIPVFLQTDSINFQRLKALIKEHGFPNIKDHGFTYSGHTNLMLLHASATSPQMHRKVLDMLGQAQDKGYVSSSFIAMVSDRYDEMVAKRKQQYGNWNFAYAMPAIQDLSKVDELRYTHNLTSFQSLCEMYNHPLPADYQARPYPANYFCK